MSSDWHSWFNSIGVVASLGVTLLIFIRTNQSKRDREFVEIAFMVNTMWSAFLASGIVKGIDKGVMRANSPVRLSAESVVVMESLRPDLERFRKDECPNCDERLLALRISEHFKEELVKLSTITGWQYEVTLLIATAVAKGESTLTEILDKYYPVPPDRKTLKLTNGN